MSRERHNTPYKGIFYREAPSLVGPGTERVYYAVFTRDGKVIEAKVGRALSDGVTPASANKVRSDYISGKRPLPKEVRAFRKAAQGDGVTVWTVTKLWEEYKRQRPDLKGLVTDENRFEKHIKPAVGDSRPEDLVPLNVDDMRMELEKDHKPATVRNTLELLRRVVNFGVEKQLTIGFSFKIKLPGRLNNEKTEDLKPAELKRLLKAIDNAGDLQAADLMKMALFTGMRRGELFRLRWEDVDFERNFIRLRDPKGGKDETIPLSPPVRELLEGHPRPHLKSPFVFPGRGGRQRKDIAKRVNEIKEAAGLPGDFRALHGLRHHYASLLASSGQVDLLTLQRLLTHKSPQMTQRYAHLRDEALRKASHLAGDLIQPVQPEADEKIETDSDPDDGNS